MASDQIYLGNPLLKKANVKIDFTPEQVKEFIKCKNDPIYFTKTYVQIVSLDEGLVPFKMWDFQEELIRKFHKSRFNIAKLPRQTGKSTTVVSYLLHYLIFNDSVNVGILANKASTARDLLARLATAYENLPKWIQQGVVVWNKGNIELENGSKILAASTSASAVRGMSFNIIFLDEFAFVPNHIADSFFASVYPTITSGKSTKVIIISTPQGMNHFYKMWQDAVNGRNDYTYHEVHWSQVPGRDAKWKEETIKNTSQRQFTQEFECEFLGSVDTLISASKLKALAFDEPITRNKGLDIYEKPKDKNEYLLTVDVSRGIGGDYSAFIVYDITTVPYKIVGKYRNNEIKPMLFPNVINDVARAYNNAWVLCEVNDVGDQVASILNFDLEYPNVLMCAMRGRAGQIVGQGFSGNKTQLGVKMSVTVKKVGCANLKQIIEDDKLIFNDYEIISELTTFIQKKQSFEADEGFHDDLVMCMVIFAWLVQQDYFKELTDNDVRQRIYQEQKNQIEQDMSPFGFITTGLEGDEGFVDDGTVWQYGDTQEDVSYMWDYR
ncbi:terminase large subunit [Cyanophage S-RIM44]|uniref:Terminase large subunit n=2 Tax=Vellamovirus TaxID=2733139 RepID=A0A127KN42_9CAUD|nr:terminase large subunit [Prochlorococcus phage Syn1]AMO43359.1 terminase large subunit [Cyanophage S-RIM44]ADO99217.1 terminase DNA packaging enzyme large subunit [Prochlorococcus phage Syn1]AOO11831.1 terminase large subunit [Cyanophage S-RIM44]AOO12532.1 terminase large subunit [Cyanophage S-RIM44]AOO12998.1 terminase large subunit [Cyanophage S-RIM44]